eukprot:497224-Amphidinium_carterae.1
MSTWCCMGIVFHSSGRPATLPTCGCKCSQRAARLSGLDTFALGSLPCREQARAVPFAPWSPGEGIAALLHPQVQKRTRYDAEGFQARPWRLTSTS